MNLPSRSTACISGAKIPRLAARDRRARNLARKRAGFALVLTLIVIALLTVIVTAFLTSSGSDRLAARAYLSRVQADAAARGGADEAMAMLKSAFEKFPDSVTAWQPDMSFSRDETGALVPNAGTVLYLRARNANPSSSTQPAAGDNPDQNVPTFNGAVNPDRQVFVLPLTSGVVGQNPSLASTPNAPVAFAARATAVPTMQLNAAQPAKSEGIDMNQPISASDTAGWIGTLPGQSRVPIYARWMPVKALDPTPSNPARTKLVARYAFWVEDESFRVPVNTSGATATRRDNANDLPLKPADVSIEGTSTATGVAFTAGSFISRRDAQAGKAFAESAGWALANGINADAANQLRFLFTTTSSALNLSRHGSVRLNLNTLGPTDGPSISATDPRQSTTVEKQVYSIISTINYHLPNFHERFFRKVKPLTITDANLSYVPASIQDGTTTYQPREVYLRRIGANIRDAIDQDSVPTILDRAGKVVAASRPEGHPGESNLNGPNPYDAIGKEGGPFLQEGRVRITGSVTAGQFNLTTHYYAEVWNPTDRDIVASQDLGANPFLKFRNAAAWRTNASGGAEVIPEDPSRDITISLAGKTFRAGRLTVITTDSTYAATPDADVIAAQASEIGTNKTVFTGSTRGGTQIQMIFRDTGSSDYQHSAILGSDSGFIEGALGSLSVFNSNRLITIPPNTGGQPEFFAGSMRGNNDASTPGQLGDPRTNNEQMKFHLYESGGLTDQTRYYNALDSDITIGSFNTNFTTPNGNANPWPDYYRWPAGNATAARSAMVVPNRDFVSIGELGHVSDPAHVARTTGTEAFLRDRGGGRTLRIGQPDDRIDADPLSPSSEGWAAWRLADIFCVDATTASERTGSGDLRLPGRVNINGVRRDNGTALRAALHGFSFLSTSPGGTSRDVPHGDPALSARSLNESMTGNAGMAALVTEMMARLARTAPSNSTAPTPDRGWGPFWERGELSELNVFSTGINFTGVDMSQAFDRGREEVFRRLIELVTTRGNVFTVYAVGQSLLEGSNGSIQVLATSRLRLTFRLNPYFGTANRNPAFEGFDFPASTAGNPTVPTSASVAKRFERPSRYDLEILEVAPVP